MSRGNIYIPYNATAMLCTYDLVTVEYQVHHCRAMSAHRRFGGALQGKVSITMSLPDHYLTIAWFRRFPWCMGTVDSFGHISCAMHYQAYWPEYVCFASKLHQPWGVFATDHFCNWGCWYRGYRHNGCHRLFATAFNSESFVCLSWLLLCPDIASWPFE